MVKEKTQITVGTARRSNSRVNRQFLRLEPSVPQASSPLRLIAHHFCEPSEHSRGKLLQSRGPKTLRQNEAIQALSYEASGLKSRTLHSPCLVLKAEG